MQQYQTIQRMQGVQVAAPIAMIGYMLPSVYLGIPINRYLNDDTQQLFRVSVKWAADRGLSQYPDATRYLYVNGTANADKHIYDTCKAFDSHLAAPQSPFDLRPQTQLFCYTTHPPLPGAPGFGGLHHGDIGFGVQYYFPVLLAAIDPVQEAKLVGLDKAITSGRYLTARDHTQAVSVGHGQESTSYHSVPVLMPNRPLTGDSLSIQLQRLEVTNQRELPAKLTTPAALNWLTGQSGPAVHSYQMSDTGMYPRLLRTYANPKNLVQTQFWSVGQVSYRTVADGHLRPVPQSNGEPSIWSDLRFPSGFLSPPANADTSYRSLEVHVGSNQSLGGFYNSPIMHQVGVFDPSKIEDFSALTKVPLTTYYPPDASPGDARTAHLLDGGALLPSQNLAGYLQQPPMMLTTIKSLHSFTDPQAFGDVASFAKAPISVIRVRVAGVTGVDPLSRARVRLVAEQIERQTGLTVDITVGSSPRQELIDLPAGKYGRPPLVLSEGWVKKGVAVALLSAIDTKSLALFGLVLLVCLLFLLNATVAAVRTRRTELGILACVGWPARQIFALLETELVATGLVAGIVGTALAATLAAAFRLQISWWQIGLITPVAILLAGLAGIGPAWRACHTTPMQAITPSTRGPRRRAAKVTTVTRLAVVGLGRTPGRAVLGAASLFVGVAALAILIAIQQAFQGNVVGTTLGDVVAIQVRGVDYLAAALTIGLGAVAVADVAYLNINERTSEIATLRSTGWRDSDVRRLFGTEGLLTAVLGAAVAVAAIALLLPIGVGTAIAAAAIAAGTGTLSAILALSVPLARLARLAPAIAITDE